MSLYLGKNKVAGNIVVNKESGNEEYLPLSGGTVDGDVTVNGDLIAKNTEITDNKMLANINGQSYYDQEFTNGQDTLVFRADTNYGSPSFHFGTLNGSNEFEDGVTVYGLEVNNPTTDNEVANKGYVDDKVGNYLPLTGGTMSGAISMGPNIFNANSGINMLNQKITNLGTPTSNTDAVNKEYVDNNILNLTPTTWSPSISVSGCNIVSANTTGYRISLGNGFYWCALGLSVTPDSTHIQAGKYYTVMLSKVKGIFTASAGLANDQVVTTVSRGIAATSIYLKNIADTTSSSKYLNIIGLMTP